MKRGTFFRLGMLAATLAFGLSMAGCDDGGGGGTSGFFQIRITGIPASIMQDGQNGYVRIGIGPANALASNGSNAIAGRDSSVPDEADKVDGSGDNQSYQFRLYNTTNSQQYIGTTGFYDLGFMVIGGTNDGTKKVFRNVQLTVNTTNTFNYGAAADL